MTITPRDIMIQTGITYRQLDYWCRKGVVEVLNDPEPGAGIPREFDESVINKIKVLVQVSNAMNKKADTALLKKVWENYHEGYVSLGGGITLRWVLLL